MLLVVFAAVVAGAAFAPRQQARESAARTLDLLLRAIPGYRPLPLGTRLPRPASLAQVLSGQAVAMVNLRAGIGPAQLEQPEQARRGGVPLGCPH